MHVFFPTFILEVDTATDCHLQYTPIGRNTRLPALDYVQPKGVPSKSASANATTPQVTPSPIVIEDEEDVELAPTFVGHWPKRPPTPPTPPNPPLDMSLLPPSTYTSSLKDLDRDELIQRLYSVDPQQQQGPIQKTQGRSTHPLECMSNDEILSNLHHPDTSPPAIRPCDTPNA
jgi:hypothetical protein